MKKILFVTALAVIMTACHNNGGDTAVEFGKIAINATTRGSVTESNAPSSSERFVLPEELVPSAKELKVEIVGNGVTQTWDTLEAFEQSVARGLTFASTQHSVTLSYGEKGVEGWNTPYFEGSTSVEVPSYELTVDAEVEVSLVNSIIAIETTDNFDGYFPQSSFKVNDIVWDKASDKLLFMNAGEVTITCQAVRQTGHEDTLQSVVTLRPTTRHKLVFDLSTAGNVTVNVSFDDKIVETIELDFELNENA